VKLYEIPGAHALLWADIQKELEELLGEVTPEMEARMAALMGASKDKITAAGMVKRNLELHAAMASAQARVFQDEAARVGAMAKSFESAADRLGELMAPALKTVGSVKTVAGTLYAIRRVNYIVAAKPGFNIKTLPQTLWRQSDPELNKKPIQDLCKLHPITPEQLGLVEGGDFKAKDLERIRAAMAVTDADLEVLAKDDLTPDQVATLEAIRNANKCPEGITWVRSESLTTALKGAKPAEPEVAPAATETVVVVPPPPVKSPEPPAVAPPVPDPSLDPSFDPFFDSPMAVQQ